MPEEPRITLNVLLKLFIYALENENKSTRTVINFSKIFASPDLFASDVEATWNTLKIFTTKTKSLPPAFFDPKPKSFSTVIDRSQREAEIKEAYKKIRQYISRFVQNGGKNYPYDAIPLSKFEKNVNLHGTMLNWDKYKIYLNKVNTICWDVLDKSKKDELIYSLMEILQRDNNIEFIFYGKERINKTQLLGTYTHPKRICIEAFLLGLLYHTHKYPDSINTKELQLQPLPGKLRFKAEFLGKKDSNIFWMDYISFKKYFEERFFSEISVNLKDNLSQNAKYPYATEELQKPSELFPGASGEHYPLQIHTEENNMISAQEFWEKRNQNIFLYASGGMGKTSILLEKIKNNTEKNKTYFLLSLHQYQEEILKDFLKETSCWILLHILLKYHYQYEYQTYETCKKCENDILQKLTELLQLLKHNPNGYTPEYILLLDGMNEISSEKQDILAKELEWICQDWKNVRIIITGRTVPYYDVFKNFKKMQLCGISDDDRNHLLSVLPDYAQIQANSRLMEILKTPLFLNLYLESRLNQNTSQLNTCGEILDNYVMNWERKISKHLALSDDVKENLCIVQTIQFAVQYILPFVATRMMLIFDFAIKKSELLTAIDDAYDTYLLNERVYWDFISHEFKKKYLLKIRDKQDIVELMLKNICFLTVVPELQTHICFTHQYFRDYFAARHILNILKAAEEVYDSTEKDNKLQFIEQNGLLYEWYQVSDLCRLIGELSGDYKNIPALDADFHYTRTQIDDYLNLLRYTPAEWIGHSALAISNIIEVMRKSRNRIICGVDFHGIILPPDLANDTQFSLDGKYPSHFEECDARFLGSSYYLGNVECMAYSPDGNSVLICLSGGHAILWDLHINAVLHEYHLDSYGELEQIIFSPDGKYAVFLAFQIIIIMEVCSGNILYHHVQTSSYRVDFYHHFHYWILHTENKIFLINMQTNQKTEIPFQFKSLFGSCSDDGKILLLGNEHTIMLFDTSQKQCIAQKHLKDTLIRSIILSDHTCLLCTKTGMFLWNPKYNETSVVYQNDIGYFFQDIFFSPDHQYCVILCDRFFCQSTMLLIHIPTGNHKILVNNMDIKQILFSDDSRYLLFVTQTEEMTSVFLYDFVTEMLQMEDEYPNTICFIHYIIAAFSSDNEHFLLSSNEEAIWTFTQHTITGEQEELNILYNFKNFKNCNFKSSKIYGNDEAALEIMGAIVYE